MYTYESLKQINVMYILPQMKKKSIESLNKGNTVLKIVTDELGYN